MKLPKYIRKNRPLSYTQGTDDNEGLWTAEFAASQCFRYMVTNNTEAYNIAWKNYIGMELLQNVTQVKGLLARSIATNTSLPNDPGRWNLYNHTKYV